MPEVSALRLREFWYIAARSRDLSGAPIARTVLGERLVLFRRKDGFPAALLDRCAHRNAPLSRGTVRDGCVECPYHGWLYNAYGRCVEIPSLRGSELPKPRVRVPAFLVEEEIGLGDAVKRVSYAIGIKPCDGCEKRAEALNRWMRFTR